MTTREFFRQGCSLTSNRIGRLVCCFGAFLTGLLVLGSTPGRPDDCLVIGKVSNDPQKHYRYLKPMVDYAAGRMRDLGIKEGRVLMAKDNAQMIEYLRQGRVDWVTETAFSALLYERSRAADILLLKWKKNASEYSTIFFTRKESPVKSLADLRGRIIALEDSGSTTAFFEPLMCLLQDNLKVQRLHDFHQRPSPDKVGYVLSHQEINSSTWVHKGLVAAGAFNNQDWNKSDHLYKNMRKDMRIFHRSQPIPRAFELVRSDLDPSIRKRLKTVLLQAHLDGKARKALQAYQVTKQFEELDATEDAAMKILGEKLLDFEASR